MLTMLISQSRTLFHFFISQPFIYLAILGNSLLLLATVIFYYIERGVNPEVTGYFDCFWWGVSTITTVGYGDVVPESTAGRVIGIILMYSGTVLFIAFVGLLVSFWMRTTVEGELVPLEKEVKEEEEIQAQILRTLIELRERLDRIEKRDTL